MTDPIKLIDAYLDGTLSEEQGASLSAWVKASPENARTFARESFIHQRLRDLTVGQVLSDHMVDEVCEATCETSRATVQVRRDATRHSQRISKRHLGFWLSTSLSIMFAGVIFAWANLDRWSYEQPRVEEHDVAFVAMAHDVDWTLSQMKWRVGDRLGPDVVRFNSGSVRLDYTNGVIVRLDGAVQFDVMSSKKSLVRSGQATVASPRSSVGFQVMTPTTDVVDRVGSRFGVEAGPAGESNVVVFEGGVKVSYIVPNTNGRSRGSFYLNAGEAVRITRNGDVSRLVSVAYDSVSGRWTAGPATDASATIVCAADEDRRSESPKFYQIVRRGLAEDARAFVDRFDEWNGADTQGLPGELWAADLVQPFHDRFGEGPAAMSVTLARPATLFVFYETSAPAPPWLTEHFTNTDLLIGLDQLQQVNQDQAPLGRGAGASIDKVFSVWKRDVNEAGTIRLGPVSKDGNHDESAVFGVAATALEQP